MKKESSGFALIIVLSAIALLTALISDFTIEMWINKLKARNTQDRTQARLNAESGLKIAVARLRIYKEAYNLIQKNENLKKNVPINILDELWNFPFIYPLPVLPEMNVLQRTALEEFKKSAILPGEIQLNISNISGRLNLNLLRAFPKAPDENNPPNPNEPSLEQEFTTLLNYALEKRKSESEEFNDKYVSLSAETLIGRLKYFISENDSYDDASKAEAMSIFSQKNITPKYGPLTSFSELSLIPGWDDEIIELIENDFTIHSYNIIEINKLTMNLLSMIFPKLNEEQKKAFFKYRDDEEDPHTVSTPEDLKAYFVELERLIPEDEFNLRFKTLEDLGIQFENTGSLFKVVSTGNYHRASYTLTAYILLPVTLPPKSAPPPAPTNSTSQNNPSNTTPPTPPPPPEPKKEPTILGEPRIREVIIS
ncbi:MAG: general secretion pathway protein GspK [Bacteriovoracaceae bacterium]|nr:general secretion pathway protein GspK [Bacteriovoracaceae bacterium]